MKLLVVKGSVVYKGKEFAKGETFECDKGVSESLLKANLVEQVKVKSGKETKEK